MKFQTPDMLRTAFSWTQVLCRKLRGRLKKRPLRDPPLHRRLCELPAEGESVSVELALNSRCSSDYDGAPELSHWGMFESDGRLSSDQIERVVSLASIHPLSDRGCRIEAHDNLLTFFIDNTAPADRRELYMVESGMQQQAASLACAALGIGTVLKGMGPDGEEVSCRNLATIRMRLDPMRPSYEGSYWTPAAPGKERSWRPGNLPDPARQGNSRLLATLQRFALSASQGAPVTWATLGQLLWAARGRTPHLYKSMPWGLTIPTWHGAQEYSAIYALAGGALYRYVNWHQGRPTHSLIAVGGDINSNACLPDALLPYSVILATSDSHARGLWEIGYQLLNLLVQATALNVAFRAKILRKDDRIALTRLKIREPIALITIGTRVGAAPLPAGARHYQLA